MNTQTQAVQTQPKSAVPKSVKSWVNSDTFRQQVALVLPKHMTPDRFVRICVTCLTRVPKLASCTLESVLRCMMTCSELGLEPDGRRAHLIPYKDQCTLIIDYKGLVELAMRSGTVSSIFAQTICDADDFTYDTGQIKHLVNFKVPRGKMYAAYCIVKFKDGGTHTEVMTKDDIDRIRSRSKAGTNGPWVTDYEEMAKKTVFRRASKWIQLSPEVAEALDRDSDPAPESRSLVAEMPMVLPDPEPEPEPQAIDVKSESSPVTPETVDPQPQAPAALHANIKPEPAASPSTARTAQEKLAEIVTGAGYSFDDFVKFVGREQLVKDAQSLGGFEDVQNNEATRLLRAQAGLLGGLAKMKEGA